MCSSDLRTSFQVSPYAFIEVAGRAQKWIDQAISRNIYLADRDIEKMSDLYQAAWEYGVKTTYYLHVKPRHGAEQSTTKVNKAKSIGTTSASGNGRRGFGGFARGASAATPAASTTPPAPTTSAVHTTPAAPTEEPQAAAPTQTNGVTPSASNGFGAAFNGTPSPITSPAPEVALETEIDVVDGVQCPIDPQERNECDSCQ